MGRPAEGRAFLDSAPPSVKVRLDTAQDRISDKLMVSPHIIARIEEAWENRAEINTATQGLVREAVENVLESLDSGKIRVAEKKDGAWQVNQWAKKAVLLSFRLTDNSLIGNGPGQASWYDKVPSKFDGWTAERFKTAGFRAVPGAIARRSAFIAPGAILMPSFVNLGAYVGEGTMVDTWVTVGSCAQIGKNVHLSGGVGIGGVLEPLQAGPVIIEDNCFIGARSEVVEGGRGGNRRRAVDGRLHRRLDQDYRPRHRRAVLRPRPRLFGGGGRQPAGASRCRTDRRVPASTAPSS